jgi:hypothetical protein
VSTIRAENTVIPGGGLSRRTRGHQFSAVKGDSSMFTKCFSYVKRQWRQVSGALAVLLMFMVPATRAVLAGNSNSNQNQNHSDYQNNNQNQASRASCSTPKVVSPVNPSSQTAKNSSYKAPWEK